MLDPGKKSDIQIEDGNWFKLHSEIKEALSMFKFTASEHRLLGLVLRLSYGFRKKSASFGTWALAYKATGIKRQNFIKTLVGLVCKRVLVVRWQEKVVAFNKKYEQWRVEFVGDTESLRALIGKNAVENVEMSEELEKLRSAQTDQDVEKLLPEGHDLSNCDVISILHKCNAQMTDCNAQMSRLSYTDDTVVIPTLHENGANTDEQRAEVSPTDNTDNTELYNTDQEKSDDFSDDFSPVSTPQNHILLMGEVETRWNGKIKISQQQAMNLLRGRQAQDIEFWCHVIRNMPEYEKLAIKSANAINGYGQRMWKQYKKDYNIQEFF